MPSLFPILFVILMNIIPPKCARKGLVIQSSQICTWSQRTVRNVSSCPQNKHDLILAAKIRNCEALAIYQNCTLPSLFKYHCVMTENQNEFVEVCSKEITSKGLCVRYIKERGQIAVDYERRCTKQIPKCPDIYTSSNTHLALSCYGLIGNISDNSTGTKKPENGDTRSKKTLAPAVAISYLAITCILLFTTIWAFRKHKVKQGRGLLLNDEKEAINLLDIPVRKMSIRQELGEIPDIESENSIFCQQYTNRIHGKDEEELIDNKSIISWESVTDEIVFNNGEFLLDIKRGEADISADENKWKTEKEIGTFKPLNTYFVPTRLCMKTEEVLKRYGVSVLAGPPGCGKTSIAFHLMLKEYYKNWTKRIVRNWNEFIFLETHENTLIYIDNFLSGWVFFDEFRKWFDVLTTIFYKYIRRTKRGNGNVHLLISMRENIIERVYRSMNESRSPVFNIDCIVDARNFKLTEEEKEDILKYQIHYAKEEKHVDQHIDYKEILNELRSSEGPIGFPLCAHLYACEKNKTYMGQNIFLYPFKYFQAQIQREVETDTSNKTLTLLLLLLLTESSKEKKKIAGVDLQNRENCENIVREFFCPEKLLPKMNLDFNNLSKVAEGLTASLLKGTPRNGYIFKHQTVCDAVGNFFCTRFYETALQVFPLTVIQPQNFSSFSFNQYAELTLRLISEVNQGNASRVFACKAFTNGVYVKHFYKQLCTFNNKRLRHFLWCPDVHHPMLLPSFFWIGIHKIPRLFDFLFSLTRERDIDADLNFYLGLFGEICSVEETLIETANTRMCKTTSDTKQAVLRFTDAENNTTVHLIILSDRSDTGACNVIKELFKDSEINNILLSKNKHGATPIMLAVRCNFKRTKVISELLHRSIDLRHMDNQCWTVFHHCVNSQKNDIECFEYLKLLLNSECDRNLSLSNTSGETVLNLAAKNKINSRILCILALTEEKDINTLDSEGRSPIYNAAATLIGKEYDPLMELEITIRISIFMIYGCDKETSDDNDLRASDICPKCYENVHKILDIQSGDQNDMAKVISDLLRKFEPDFVKKVHSVLIQNERILPEMAETICKAVAYLAKHDFSVPLKASFG